MIILGVVVVDVCLNEKNCDTQLIRKPKVMETAKKTGHLTVIETVTVTPTT